MTDKLTPGMLRDLASLERMMMRQGRERFEFLEHEAARREAEQPCWTPGECEVGGCLKPSACQAAAVEARIDERLDAGAKAAGLWPYDTAAGIGEREGPGSAAAPFKPHKACKTYDRCRRDGFCEDAWNCSEDKPVPAADEMAASILALEHRDPCYPTPHPRCVTVAEFIRAQAREIAATNGHLDIAQATCNMQTERADRAEAENARLREALLDARDMVQSWGAYASDYFKDKWGFADDIAKLNAALARGGEHG